MQNTLLTLIMVCLSFSCIGNEPLSLSKLQTLLTEPSRSTEDKQHDANRKPAQIMRFVGVASGQSILDIYAGGGWYSELFAHAVGEHGKVYAHNDALTWRFGKKEMLARSKRQILKNIMRFDQVAIKDIPLPSSSIDIAFMGINYHDLFFTHRYRNGELQIMRDEVVDYRKAFSHIKNLLKPAGVLIIIDHHAKAGSGYDAANHLHRIDANIVKYQLQSLGFVLKEEAFYLKNPNDDLEQSVFAEGIRGKTSRFILKFGKAE
ncbi:class I SAM-dependent methyltransferase [Pseudoalteromonas spongiae]|uniref:class I SAM-dependent methyltransferase n=1 Tax=Pseudoalteromonas spongiae TaxID=298657 RepID=UPI00110BC4F6|nr:methyltransferase domain-containing protein [Pseudoalteromonas spongiae]TMO84368.1 hypothetical protein CWC15_11365 [Pseudoalteromonas spongiae]